MITQTPMPPELTDSAADPAALREWCAALTLRLKIAAAYINDRLEAAEGRAASAIAAANEAAAKAEAAGLAAENAQITADNLRKELENR